MNTDSEELIEYYDADGAVLGVCTRYEADTNNYIYPNAIIFVFTSTGKVWIQQRAYSKRHYPGLWDPTACGAIAYKEDPLLAAERELEEEMQLRCQLHFVETFLNTFPGEDDQASRSRMSSIYIGISDDTPVGNHEVAAIAAFAIDELLTKCRQQPEDFVPSFDIEYMKALAGYRTLSAA